MLRLGFLDRTPQGRIATDGARQHLSKLGYDVPPPRRSDLDQRALWEGGPADAATETAAETAATDTSGRG